METDRYRWRAFEAQRRALEASDPAIKAQWETLAREWLALVEQGEWLERRYSGIISGTPERAAPVLQQQQIQPKKT